MFVQLTQKQEERDIVLEIRTRIDSWAVEQEEEEQSTSVAATSVQHNQSAKVSANSLNSQSNPRVQLTSPQRRAPLPEFLQEYDHVLTDGINELYQFVRKSLQVTVTLEQLRRTMVSIIAIS